MALAACDGSLPPAGLSVAPGGSAADAAVPAPAVPGSVEVEIGQAIASAVCEKVDLCCPGGERARVLGVGEDRAECELSFASFYGRQYGSVVGAIERSLTTFDRQLLQICVEHYRQAGCQAPGFMAAADCMKVLRGTVRVGQTCTMGFECESRVCSAAVADGSRSCGARAADGQACERDSECVSGFCQSAFLSGSCASPTRFSSSCAGDGFWLVL